MSNLKKTLDKKIYQSFSNNFGLENYDELRFGKYIISENGAKKKKSLSQIIKQIVKDAIGYVNFDSSRINWLNKYQHNLQRIYDHLNKDGKFLLVELIAYRHLGYKRVRLKRNNYEFQQAIALGESLANANDTYDPHFMHFILEKMDLNPIGHNIKLYFSGAGVAIDFIIEQYAYKQDGKKIVEVEQGDYVIDAGGCWGDTALYFANKTGVKGKVYSFEFIPNNIHLFNINRSFNLHLTDQIELVERPISNKSGDKIYFKDHGPGSKIEFAPFDDQTGSTTTISIDDFVRENNITKIDFIKMDIEGAELTALEGAMETIKKFRPKLAIAIYHSMDDFVGIPNWILNLNLDYEIFIDHFTIHAEETMCFAKPKSY